MPRSKAFDPDQALERAMNVFWDKGYEGTSIQDLVGATGVNRASLYQTFGDKRQLFQKALERFRNGGDRDLNEVTARYPAGVSRIRAALEDAGRAALSDPRGCFVVNAAAELATRDQQMLDSAKDTREQIERFFTRCLRDAVKIGEIRPEANPITLARFLTNALFGLRLTAKTQPTRKLIADVVDTTLGAIVGNR